MRTSLARTRTQSAPAHLPARARAGSRVVLSLTSDEALAAPPVLTFAGTDPGFALAAVNGVAASFTWDVDVTAPQGTHTLAGVRLEDAAGNARDVDVAAQLGVVEFNVDNVPPQITSAALTPTRVSANAGRDLSWSADSSSMGA